MSYEETAKYICYWFARNNRRYHTYAAWKHPIIKFVWIGWLYINLSINTGNCTPARGYADKHTHKHTRYSAKRKMSSLNKQCVYQNQMCCNDSSPPNAANMCWWTGSAFVQVMASHLFGTKPLHGPMLNYSQWTLRHKRQWNQNLSSKEMYLNISSAKLWSFCPGKMSEW